MPATVRATCSCRIFAWQRPQNSQENEQRGTMAEICEFSMCIRNTLMHFALRAEQAVVCNQCQHSLHPKGLVLHTESGAQGLPASPARTSVAPLPRHGSGPLGTRKRHVGAPRGAPGTGKAPDGCRRHPGMRFRLVTHFYHAPYICMHLHGVPDGHGPNAEP